MGMIPERIKDVRPGRNGVKFIVSGSSSHQSGAYTNERSAEKTVTVSERKAREILEELEQVLDDE